jgi:hypothetical protein
LQFNVQVMQLSENLKLRPDHLFDEHASGRLRGPQSEANAADTRADDEESQMRKALGLLGEPPRHRPEPERTEPPHRATERFGGGGALHRRRFVQDGDVPVTILRRDGNHDTLAPRPNHTAGLPTSSRLQRVEATLAAETAARERAERLLNDAHAVVRDLQTKIGHAELARTEAVEALQREREASIQLRRDAAAWEVRIREAEARTRAAEQALSAVQEQLQAESRLRRDAERALKAAEAACSSVKPVMPFEDEAAQTWSPPVRRLAESASVSPAIRRRRAAQPAGVEQEPVKWWLNSKSTRRR